jgi:hypothetical protein
LTIVEKNSNRILKGAQDFATKSFANFHMSRNGFNMAGPRIAPERMGTALTLEIATYSAKLL